MEWFTASFPGAVAEEVLDGVRIVRRGRQWTVHVHAFLRYRRKLRGHFDLVIDQTNTIPFFTPLWAGIPAFLMIWQLAREVWWYESRFPFSALGYALEPIYLRAYRRTEVLTFSESTAADLRGLGFEGDITMVPVGIEAVETPAISKLPEPSFVYVGRLSPSKRVHEILHAFALFRKQTGRGQLVLIGDGPSAYVRELLEFADRLGIEGSLELCGWLNGAAKHKRMAEAHSLLMASAREGWGLVVTECNACGTPAIVYNVPGLRDSVRHLETGLVVAPNPQALADGMAQLVGDGALYMRLREAGLRWSSTFNYAESAKVVHDRIATVMAL